MTTYHRLLFITALTSALLTFCLLQTNAINSSATIQKQPQQLQSIPQPQATEFYVTNQPGMMTLVWQPYAEQVCQPQSAAYYTTPVIHNNRIGI